MLGVQHSCPVFIAKCARSDELARATFVSFPILNYIDIIISLAFATS